MYGISREAGKLYSFNNMCVFISSIQLVWKRVYICIHVRTRSLPIDAH